MTGTAGTRTILFLGMFAVAFAFVESSVVVYLRTIYYPEGFSFPLKMMTQQHLSIELLRELATIIMLIAAAALAGRGWLQIYCYFLIGFGIWDLFYYIWLKVLLNWPSTIFDWDILFLIPIPWIGPVIAPVTLSFLMIIGGILLLRRGEIGGSRQHGFLVVIVTILGTALILFSFLRDTDATLRLQLPQPYRYEFLIAGMMLYVFALARLLRKR